MTSIIASVKRGIRRAFMTRAQRRFELVGPPEFWEMKRRFQIDFLRRQGLQPQHYLLDIGCGVLRGGIPIIEYIEVGHYYGIEARAKVLAEGRKELAETKLEHKQPHLTVGEHLGELSLKREFDYVWAFSVLIHLEDPILEEVIQFVARHVKPDGVFYANVDTTDKEDGRWQEFPGVGRPLRFYAEVLDRNGLSYTDVGSLRELGHITGGEADEQRMLAIRKKQ
jgi:SAM-dependent methyltransferase